MGKIGVGALKPNKVKARKVTDTVSGHMPVNSGSFGRKMGGGKMPKAGTVKTAGM